MATTSADVLSDVSAAMWCKRYDEKTVGACDVSSTDNMSIPDRTKAPGVIGALCQIDRDQTLKLSRRDNELSNAIPSSEHNTAPLHAHAADLMPRCRFDPAPDIRLPRQSNVGLPEPWSTQHAGRDDGKEQTGRDPSQNGPPKSHQHAAETAHCGHAHAKP